MSLAAVNSFVLGPFIDSCVSLGTAFVLGMMIGAERQYRQRTAGLRTNVLVAVGAAAFVDIGMRLNGNVSGAQVLAYVVSGVGFLGAGVIMKEGLNVRGLNTAATLWSSAAAGAAAGADYAAEAVIIAFCVLGANTLLRPLVNLINRQPLDEVSTEATYELVIVAVGRDFGRVREAVLDDLDKHRYAVSVSEAQEQSEDLVEIRITLAASTAVPEELDAIVSRVRVRSDVRHANWAMRTGD